MQKRKYIILSEKTPAYTLGMKQIFSKEEKTTAEGMWESIFSLRLLYKLAPIILLVSFAAIQFILLLRHKSPYLSDSYFYKHRFYEFQGNSFTGSYKKIISQIDLEKQDEIGKNIFINIENYKKSYEYFTKRPFYPYTAYSLNFIFQNEYISLLFPVFLSYLGVVIITYLLLVERFTKQYALLGTTLLIAFYPFLDWSTYFLTDTIGTFFWMIQLIFIYKFLQKRSFNYMYAFIFMFCLSLFNREQSLLFVPLLMLTFILLKIKKYSKMLQTKILQTFLISLIISLIYLTLSFTLINRSIIENITYIMNNFGLYSNSFNSTEIFNFLILSAIKSHNIIFIDLIRHHWWFLITFFSYIAIIKSLFSRNSKILDILVLASGLASYLLIFWPTLSYRFFIPSVITIIYFSQKLIYEYFKKNVILNKYENTS